MPAFYYCPTFFGQSFFFGLSYLIPTSDPSTQIPLLGSLRSDTSTQIYPLKTLHLDPSAHDNPLGSLHLEPFARIPPHGCFHSDPSTIFFISFCLFIEHNFNHCYIAIKTEQCDIRYDPINLTIAHVTSCTENDIGKQKFVIY